MDKVYRVRPAWQGGTCAVRHPEHGEHVVPDPREAYRADDPIVRAYPWLFVAADADVEAPTPTTEVRIETATARPTVKRRR